MITLLSPAKTMRSTPPAHTIVPTCPVFQSHANCLANELKDWTADDWSNSLNLSPTLATDVTCAYEDFDTALTHPAVLAYDGIAYKYLRPHTLTSTQLSTLYICSFLYGLLRATDAIATYRLEGGLRLRSTASSSLFSYWRPLLTQHLMQLLQEDPDHTLLFVASEEMKKLFDWKRIARAYTVLQPLFLHRSRGKLRQVVVHTKMYRGTIARTALLEGWHGTPEELRSFADSEDMEFAEGASAGVYHLILG